MELIKINEAYKLSDSLESGWITDGQVIKELSGVIRVSFSTLNNNSHIGNYNYDLYVNGKVSSSATCEASIEDAFREYCASLVDQIFNQMDNQLN